MQKLKKKRREDGENGREYAYRVLRENIMTLHLPPGSPLQEPKIAETLSLSRTPVREALLKLRKEFLVEIYPQSGTLVSPIDLDLLREGVFLRIKVESAIITRLFGNLNERLIQQLSDNLGRQKQLLSGGAAVTYEYLGLDDEFHRFMYQAGRKDNVYKACKSLSSQFDRIRHLLIIDGAMHNDTLFDEHKHLYMQLLTGMGQNLIPFYKNHLSAYTNHLPVLLEKYPGYFQISEQRRTRLEKQRRSEDASRTLFGSETGNYVAFD